MNTKIILITGALTLSGCSTLNTIGNIEAFNEVDGLRQIRETASTIAKMDGKRNSTVVNTGAINRKYGEMKGLDNRKYDFHDIPHLLQSVRYIFE